MRISAGFVLTKSFEFHEKSRNIDDYVDVVSFDISNPDLNITDVIVIMPESDKLIRD